MKFAVEDSSFWAHRINESRINTLPAIYDQMKQTGRWDAMRLTWKHGDGNKPHIFWDSDIAKTVESCCYALENMDATDPLYSKFSEWINDAIDMIGKAQGPDGYINIYYTVVEPEKRWTDIAHQHELYCAGHLLEAAVAHYKLTGEMRFLDIMIRYVHYIRQVFGPNKGQKRGYPGHEEIELALLRLYEVKPEPEYLELLKYFVEYRGLDYGEFYAKEAVANGCDPDDYIPKDIDQSDNGHSWPDAPHYWYMQAHKPVREQDEIRGHSVRAMYFLSAVQGLANITSDGSLHKAVNNLWRNMVDKKFYIHGGIGAIADWEGFGKEYELPLNCYAETCASIGVLFLGKRMLEHCPDGEVSRIMSRALYNNIIGGASLDGRSFYYNQPLIGQGHKRSDWFEVSCCPPNYSRLLNSLQDYSLTISDSLVSLNLYIPGTYESGCSKVTVATNYPIEGQVSISIEPKTAITFAVALPAGGYQCSYTGQSEEKDGYLYFRDVSERLSFDLSFDISAIFVHPDPNVTATKGKIAIERGPFVYGLESIDSPIPLAEVRIPTDLQLSEKLVEIQGTKVVALIATINGQDFQFVPYFVIGNREPGDNFIVWFDTV